MQSVASPFSNHKQYLCRLSRIYDAKNASTDITDKKRAILSQA